MEEPEQWVAVLAALGAGLALARALVARLRGRAIEARLLCPKTGAHVQCALLYDDRREVCLGVMSCSGSREEGAPSCDQSCVRLLNLGLPLETDEGEGGPG